MKHPPKKDRKGDQRKARGPNKKPPARPAGHAARPGLAGGHDHATRAWLARTDEYLAGREEIEGHERAIAEQLDGLKSRAVNGDSTALEIIYDSAFLAVQALEELRSRNPELVRKLAATKLHWPVGLCAYLSIGKITEIYRNLVDSLKLGSDIDCLFDYKRALKKSFSQNAVRHFVVETLKRMQDIRRKIRRATRLGWYGALRGGHDSFPHGLSTNDDPVTHLRVSLALKLPPLDRSEESCCLWSAAVEKLIDAESDGEPERHPLFRPCGEPGARSKASSYKGRDRLGGQLSHNSFDANIRAEIMDQIRATIRYVAPEKPTEKIDGYLPPGKNWNWGEGP